MNSIVLWSVFIKTVLDVVVSVGFVQGLNGPMALMFFGFAVADAGALWLAIR